MTENFSIQVLNTNGTSEELEHILAQAGQEQPAYIIKTPEQMLLLRLKEQGRLHMEKSGHSAAWNNLDVAVAHTLILEGILGLSAKDMTSGTHIRYSHDTEYVLQTVQNGNAQAAMLLNATHVRQIRDVAQADDKMPQKSTYFYPKLITGLVLNPLW
jgi:uncharacterized protein (DUF1015 family)